MRINKMLDILLKVNAITKEVEKHKDELSNSEIFQSLKTVNSLVNSKIIQDIMKDI